MSLSDDDENDELFDDDDDISASNQFPQVHNDPDCFWTVKMHEAHCFRAMIDVLALNSSYGILRFSADQICITMGNKNTTVLNDVVLDTGELDYEFGSKFPQILFKCNLVMFKEAMSCVGKTENMLMYKKPKLLPIYCNPRVKSSGAKQTIFKFVQPFIIEEFDNYEIPTYTADDRHPNCKIGSQEFSKACADLASFKRPHVTLIGYPRGVVFSVYGADGTKLGITSFGETPGSSESEPQPKEVTTIYVLNENLKNLSRWNNLHPNSLVKLFIEIGKPLKICSSVGGFGKITQYISNQPPSPLQSSIDRESSSSYPVKAKTKGRKPSN